MSYGAQGAPKGYSNPRLGGTSSATGAPPPRQCQKCNSTSHWTAQCTAAPGTGYTSRPSRTQMLRRGIRPEPVAVTTAKTSREAFEADLKERAKLLEEELRAEAGLPTATTTAGATNDDGVEVEVMGSVDCAGKLDISADVKNDEHDADGIVVKDEPEDAADAEEMGDGSAVGPKAAKGHRAEVSADRTSDAGEAPEPAADRAPVDQL